MYDCVVIGAGPSGLVCTKELLEQGVQKVVCVEQFSEIGGTFARSYDSLVLTTSTILSMFSDFWVGDNNEHQFWTKDEAIEYWKRYAHTFGVIEHIRFHTKVVSLSWAETYWEIKLNSDQVLKSRRIVLATGNNSYPKYPAYKDLLSNIDILHVKDYRNAAHFKNKHVLVVGGGESGADIALEVAKVAKKCSVSLRHTTGWLIPRLRRDFGKDRMIAVDSGLSRMFFLFPGKLLGWLVGVSDRYENDAVFHTAADMNQVINSNLRFGILGSFGTKNHSIPKAVVYHDCNIVSEVVKVEDGGRTLTTSDGEVLRDVDAVIFCTGYRNYIPFLPEKLKEINPRTLYKNIFHPEWRDCLAWIGMARANYGSQLAIMEMQARMFAQVCTNKFNLPSSEVMIRVAQADESYLKERFEHNANIQSLVDIRHYIDDLAHLIGCKPPLWKYFFSDPKLWLRIFFGTYQSTQFRLSGPGSKEKLARELIMKLPIASIGMLMTILKGAIGLRRSHNVRTNKSYDTKGM